ncbi:MAG: polysaccharide biosynthesis tyrosine autokinase [Planctomycetaceae bacterium]|nr:polysaccharide biosynthesis tyrosine autokinase [Planctomycetaceae bacterium]
MVPPSDFTPVGADAEGHSGAELAHSVLRLVLAVRYRKNLVFAVMAMSALLGGLYYATAKRYYAAKAQVLVTQPRADRLDTSLTNDESVRQNIMPTYENIIRSAKVVEGAVCNLAPADRIDMAGASQEHWVSRLQANLSAKAIRSTNVLEIRYRSLDPQVAVNVVQAVVQSYLDFMDRMQRGTAGEISRMLTKERQTQAEQLQQKQKELLEVRRQVADMGFRSEGKTLHPTVQRAVYFNDALIAAQKKRVQEETLLAGIQAAIERKEDVGQYLMAVGDEVGRDLLLGSLGLGGRDGYAQANLEQALLADRAALQAVQQNLGPNHPEVQTLAEKVRQAEHYLGSANERLAKRVAELGKSDLGPWLVRTMQQKVDQSRREEQVLAARFEEARAEAINLSGQLAQVEMLERDVKRLSDMNDVLLNQIAAIDLKQNGQEVRVAVIEEPQISKTPVSPRLSIVLVLVVLGGMGASLGLVTLLDALDDRFRSVEEMQGRLGVPLLSMVQQLTPPESTGPRALVTHAMPTSVASESFRTLRTALSLTHPDARQIVVTSAEAGDGKTTTLANLAVCYAQANKRTLLIDADMRRPGLTGLMAMRGPLGLSEVLRSEEDIARVAKLHIRHSGVEGLDVLPSGPRPTDPAELLGSPRFSQLLAWAETLYDMILVDSPPILATTDTAVIGRLVDGVIMVVQPAKNRRRLVTRVVERLSFMKIPALGMVINRTGSEDDQGYYGYHHYGYGEEYGYGYGNNAYGHEETTRVKNPASSDAQVSEDDEEPPLLVPRRAA